MTSYGGNLTIHHRSVFSGSPVEDSEVIMRGRDGTVLHYGLGAGHRTSDRETSDRFMFTVRFFLGKTLKKHLAPKWSKMCKYFSPFLPPLLCYLNRENDIPFQFGFSYF